MGDATVPLYFLQGNISNKFKTLNLIFLILNNWLINLRKKKLFSKSPSSRHAQVDVKPLISQIPHSVNHLYYKYHSNGMMNMNPCVMGSLCIRTWYKVHIKVVIKNVHIKWSKTFYEMLRHIKVVHRSRLIYSIKKTLMCAVTYVARFRNKNLYASIKKWWHVQIKFKMMMVMYEHGFGNETFTVTYTSIWEWWDYMNEKNGFVHGNCG